MILNFLLSDDIGGDFSMIDDTGDEFLLMFHDFG